MKINLIIPSFYPATVYGGPIFSTLHACRALSELEDVTMYVSTTNANREKKLEVELNKWILFNSNFFVKYYNTTFIHILSFPMFANIWKDIKKADIVQVQPVFNLSSIFAIVYSRILSKPILISPRGSMCKWGLAQGSQFKRMWLRLFINPFKNHLEWHATSEAEKMDILNLFPKSRVHVISNGIDLKSFSNSNIMEKDVYMELYVGKKILPSNIIVSMGRLHKVKGFDILIKAFSKVINFNKNAVLLIAGKDVGEKEELLNLIKSLSLENCVFFVGELSDQKKIDFLANADLFVLPSHTENFGNVYIESLAAGTPIVASKGTPWEEVENYKCGKWVENNVEDTSSAILDMLLQDKKSLFINSKGLAAKYDWRNIAIEFRSLFKEMLRK